MDQIFDVAVIGGGPAGYVSAIKAAMLGANVVLFEKSVVGGTCLNRGCIPTKSYVKTAEVLEQIHSSAQRGIVFKGETSVDLGKVVDYKNGVVKQLTGGVAGLLRSRGVKVVNGEAKMLTPTTISCDGKTFEAKNTLLCGGSVCGRIPIPGVELEGVMTSDDILDMREMPKRLCIIGGGVIGCEIATAFNAFGSEVNVVEVAPTVVPMMDAEISALMKTSLEKQGIKINVGVKVEGVEKKGKELVVKTSNGDVVCDKVLLSVGRKADLTSLGDLKVEMDRGYVKVADDMRTNIPNIFAPGDINGKIMLAHSAFKMGEVAAENAVHGTNKAVNLNCVPSCVYTIPEASSVGLTQKEAEEKFGKDNISVGKFPFAANGRALACGENVGMIKVIAHKQYGEMLGVHMFGASVTEMIAEPAALMDMEVTIHEVAEIIHPHPTFSEAFMEACADAKGECIHLPKRK